MYTWKAFGMTEILFVLALLGGLSGSLGGVWWDGYEGLILGGSIGLVIGVLFWASVCGMICAITPFHLEPYHLDTFRQDEHTNEPTNPTF